MLSKLPRSLICLTLSHSVDDPDVVEKYLEEYPEETEGCLPIALRDMLISRGETLPFAEKLPPMKIPTSGELAQYLTLIWSELPKQKYWSESPWRNTLLSAARHAPYLLPYFIVDRIVPGLAYDANNSVTRELTRKDNLPMLEFVLPYVGADEKRDTLAEAAKECKVDAARIILRHGPVTLDNPLYPHVNSEQIPIIAASHSGCVPIIKLIIEAKADVNTDTGEPLRVAAQEGKIDAVNVLLDAGADINVHGGSPIYAAITRNKDDVVRILLERKANVNAGTSTPLVGAAFRDTADIARALIERKADVNAHSAHALGVAAQNGKIKVVKLLIESKVNPQYFPAALLQAVAPYREDTSSVVRLLLHTGTPLPLDEALVKAVKNVDGFVEDRNVRALLDAKADINAVHRAVVSGTIAEPTFLHNILREYGY